MYEASYNKVLIRQGVQDLSSNMGCLENVERQVCALLSCCCCLAMFGPVALCIGVGFLIAGASDRRTPSIELFNSAMANSGWNTGGTPLIDSFSSLSVTAHLTWGSASQQSSTLVFAGSATSLSVDGSASEAGKASVSAASLSDFVYESKSQYAVNFNDGVSMNTCDWSSVDGAGCEPKDTLGLSVTLNGGSPFTIPVEFLTEKASGSHSFSDCRRPDGWNEGSRTCYKYKVVREICIKVHNTGTPTSPVWAPDGTATPSGTSSYGCVVEGKSARLIDGFHLIRRTLSHTRPALPLSLSLSLSLSCSPSLPSSRGRCGKAALWNPRTSMATLQATSSSSLTQKGGLTVTLYASEGPTVEFYNVMGAGHSLSFGNSQAEDLLTGGIFAGVGGCWTLCFGGALILTAMCCCQVIRSIFGGGLRNNNSGGGGGFNNQGYVRQQQQTTTTTTVVMPQDQYQPPVQAWAKGHVPAQVPISVAYAVPMPMVAP